jgi:hypothetical protein
MNLPLICNSPSFFITLFVSNWSRVLSLYKKLTFLWDRGWMKQVVVPYNAILDWWVAFLAYKNLKHHGISHLWLLLKNQRYFQQMDEKVRSELGEQCAWFWNWLLDCNSRCFVWPVGWALLMADGAGIVLKLMGSSGDASTVVMAVPVRKGLRPFWMMTVMRQQLLSHGCGCAWYVVCCKERR